MPASTTIAIDPMQLIIFMISSSKAAGSTTVRGQAVCHHKKTEGQTTGAARCRPLAVSATPTVRRTVVKFV
jgi:hypothetical protein